MASVRTGSGSVNQREDGSVPDRADECQVAGISRPEAGANKTKRKTRTYWICSFIVMIIVAGLVALAVRTGNLWLAVITLLWAFGTLYICRKRLHEVIEDERNVRINEKAAMKALEVLFLAASSPGLSSIRLAFRKPISPRQALRWGLQ